MKKLQIFLLVLIVIGLGLIFTKDRWVPGVVNFILTIEESDSLNLETNDNNIMKTLKIESSAFTEGKNIPAKYTCDGENVNPPLTISNIPAETKSLVLIMDDPDIPETVKQSRGIEVFDHWVVFNISPSLKEVTEGVEPAGIRGVNSRGDNQYTGPCPPDREHRYFFKIYALNTELSLQEGSSKSEVESAMQGHIVASEELMGRYERKK